MAVNTNLQDAEAIIQNALTEIQAGITTLQRANASIDEGDADYTTALDAAQAANSQLLTQISQLQDTIAALSAVQTFSGLELIPATVAGGSVANSSGNTGVAADAQGVPSTICAFRDLFANGLPYANKYWYWQLLALLAAANSTKTKFKYSVRLMLPTAADCSSSQAVELDIEQRITQTCFNVGCQFDFAEGLFRIWNRAASTATVPHGWISANIPTVRWTPGAWHSVVLEAHRDQHNVYYDAVTIDGVRTDLSAFSFQAIPLNESDCLNCAIQLDGNKAGASYRLHIDQVDFTVS